MICNAIDGSTPLSYAGSDPVPFETIDWNGTQWITIFTAEPIFTNIYCNR